MKAIRTTLSAASGLVATLTKVSTKAQQNSTATTSSATASGATTTAFSRSANRVSSTATPSTPSAAATPRFPSMQMNASRAKTTAQCKARKEVRMCRMESLLW